MAKVYCDTAGALTANCGLTLDLWKKALLSRLPGVTEATVTCELQAAVREFYLQSSAWREQVGPFRVYANRDLVWLNPVDAYSNIMWVRGAWLELGDRTAVLQPLPGRITTARTDQTPTHFSCADPYVLRLWPTPAVDLGEVLWVDASLVPLPDAIRLPNVAASHHYEPILEGALGRLFAMPNKPWTDPALAVAYLRSFRRRCIMFRDVAARGYSPVDAPHAFPRFA